MSTAAKKTNHFNWIFNVIAVCCLLVGAVWVEERISTPLNPNDENQYELLADKMDLLQRKVDKLASNSLSFTDKEQYSDIFYQDLANLKISQNELNKAFIEFKENLSANTNSTLTDASLQRATTDEILNFESEYQAVAQRVSEQKSYLDSSLFQESIDEDWSQQVESYVNNLLDKKQLQSIDINDLRCGETFCSMSFASDSSNELTSLGYEVDIGGTEGWVYRQQDEVLGKEVLVMYLARDGYSLPNHTISDGF